ncbi:hypothetical protein LCGC14_1947650 [marine sediment metagenome]|uniref:Uncharacterized protein n=1 Tax=marine sediment metagenome TaxID=412755 RepID=A0A0F9IFG2_9ZZZZ
MTSSDVLTSPAPAPTPRGLAVHPVDGKSRGGGHEPNSSPTQVPKMRKPYTLKFHPNHTIATVELLDAGGNPPPPAETETITNVNPKDTNPMTDLHHLRDRAMHAMLAAINNIVEHPGEPANLALLRQAIDAFADHAIATARAAQPHDDVSDHLAYPDA